MGRKTHSKWKCACWLKTIGLMRVQGLPIFTQHFKMHWKQIAYLLFNSGLQKHKVCEIIPLSLCYSPNQAEQESNIQSTLKQGRNPKLVHHLSNCHTLMGSCNYKAFLSSKTQKNQTKTQKTLAESSGADKHINFERGQPHSAFWRFSLEWRGDDKQLQKWLGFHTYYEAGMRNRPHLFILQKQARLSQLTVGHHFLLCIIISYETH